jgi:hypothetical protein
MIAPLALDRIGERSRPRRMLANITAARQNFHQEAILSGSPFRMALDYYQKYCAGKKQGAGETKN